MENKIIYKTKNPINGPSSFWMHNNTELFKTINIQKSNKILDIGCGNCDYSYEFLKRVGDDGAVLACDINETLINNLKKQAKLTNQKNITFKTCNILNKLDFKNNTFDICFISTILHCINFEKHSKNIFKELKRILKPNGKIFIIECKKEKTQFGPPLNIRISAKQIEEIGLKTGLKKINYLDLGNNYMIGLKK